MAPGHTAHQLEGFALGASVAPAIRGKILSDEYICLGLLLTPNQSDEFAVSVSQNALQVKQINKNKGIFSIDQWSQAFSIFMSVYLEKFPNQVQQLLKYSFTIREMAKTFQGYAWRSYDENFRLCRATSLWPWDKINQELYMRSVSSSFAATLPQPQFARPPIEGTIAFGPFASHFAARVSHRKAGAATSLTSTTANKSSSWRGVTTPINVKRLAHMLVGYNRPQRDVLIRGFKYGFHVGYLGPNVTVISRNHKSAMDNASACTDLIDIELRAGRVAGPYTVAPFSHYHISPIGLVPKKEAGKFRLNSRPVLP
jgi:hypothetical protein